MSSFQIAPNLGRRAHTARGRTLRGGWAFVPLLPKTGVISLGSVYCKNCIPGSQGRCTLGFCIEAIKSPTSLYKHYFGGEAQENDF